MMTETEILEIIKDSKRLHSLVNQFRQNPDASELMVLLNSDNDNIVEVGAYIAGELLIDKADAEPMVFLLHQLISHPNSPIRFHALGALFPFLDRSNPATSEMLTKLSHDPNEGVRRRVEATLKRLDLR